MPKVASVPPRPSRGAPDRGGNASRSRITWSAGSTSITARVERGQEVGGRGHCRRGIAPFGSSRMPSGATPISRICSATRKRCSLPHTTTGALMPGQSATRSAVSATWSCQTPAAGSCFGSTARDSATGAYLSRRQDHWIYFLAALSVSLERTPLPCAAGSCGHARYPFFG